MDKATVTLKVSADTKARWVREAQQSGQKLTNWIIEKIDGTSRPVLDVRTEPNESKRWYAVIYHDGIGPMVALHEREPEWTNDYYVVITESWYPGTEEEWKASIADKVLDHLADKYPRPVIK